ncbi:MAG: DUF4405 domain-containing protein [Verrucomicrobiae bacterium]|nr:DUF4405 domain-containing protein [Verrucomicrobiae bacterium]
MADPAMSSMKRASFSWRALTSVLVLAGFIILVVTGIMLFVSPPGRVANWTNWTLLGLTKKQWTALHVCFSALFLGVSVVHLLLNWRPMVGYFKDRLAGRLGFRWEWATALLLCAGVAVGTHFAWPPFKQLLAWNEALKESWETPGRRAPIPHAELLSLAELARQAGVALEVATQRLAAAGLSVESPEVQVQELAQRHNRSAQQIYDVMVATPGGRGKGRQGGGGGAGGGGGGVGWKTLAQFCQDEKIALDTALQRLGEHKIQASTNQTLREIAVANGFSRPFELVEILRGDAKKH